MTIAAATAPHRMIAHGVIRDRATEFTAALGVTAWGEHRLRRAGVVAIVRVQGG